MQPIESSVKADVFLSCFTEKHYSDEMLIQKNTLIRIISGEMRVMLSDRTYILRPGDTVLFPRNHLAKVTKYPANGQPYKSVAIYFAQELLRKYYLTHAPAPALTDVPQITVFDHHLLLDSLFASLLPYFSLSGELPADIAAGKIEEAIAVLRAADGTIDQALSHFEEPGKIDLVSFMDKHYMFNLSLEKFGYLTGRSLTSFKRDFKKAYNVPPQRWLTQKRLELAHYQIAQQKRKPTDVYFEVGFENLSHFSFAFKKQFGYNPTAALS